MPRRSALAVRDSRRVSTRAMVACAAALLLSISASPAQGATSFEGAVASRPKEPRCLGKTATIVGSNRADSRRRRIVGTRRADVIVSRGGADRVLGRGGADLICAGPGNDRVDGGAGADKIAGGGGRDRIGGGPGDDLLSGGDGDDHLDGGLGTDRCDGGGGINRLLGCEGPPAVPDPPPAQTPPVAAPDTAATSEDDPVTVAVLGNDTDPDGDPLTLIGIDTGTARGAVTIVGDTVVYDPAGRFEDLAAGRTASETFNYSVGDGRTAVVTGAVTVTVSGVDDSPVAVDDEAGVDEDAASTSIDVLANDTDADGGSKQVLTVDDSNAYGTVGVAGAGSGLTYTPAPDYCNSGQGALDTFTYSVNGGSSATVKVAVACVEDAPVAVDDDVIASEDTAIDVYALANDSDPDGDALALTSAHNESGGSVTADPDGGFVTFTPVANYCGLASFDYTVSDGTTTTSATVRLSVACANDAPVAVDDDATTLEDTPTDVYVLLNDVDPDGDSLGLVSAGNPAMGSVIADLDGGYVTFTPAADFCGLASFDYTVSDGTVIDSGSVTVTVDCVEG